MVGLHVVEGTFNRNLDDKLQALHPRAMVRQTLDHERQQLAGARIPPSVRGAPRRALQHALDESFIAGFRVAMLVGAALALAGAVSAATLVEGLKPGAATRGSRAVRAP